MSAGVLGAGSASRLTVNRTKYFWLFSPTQLLTQGQWWSIFRMHRLQTLKKPKGRRSGPSSRAGVVPGVCGGERGRQRSVPQNRDAGPGDSPVCLP